MDDMESKSLIQDEDKRPVEFARNIADGYTLVPLKQRHVFWRLDVWRFMCCYVLSMVFDICSEALNGSFAVLDMLPAVFFPLALSFYVGLFCFVNGAYFGVRLLDIKGCQLDWQSLVGHHV